MFTYQTPGLGLCASNNVSIDALGLWSGALGSRPPAVGIILSIVTSQVQTTVGSQLSNWDVGCLGPVNRVVKVLEFLGGVHAVASGDIPVGRPLGRVDGKRRLIVLAFSSGILRSSLRDVRDSNVGGISLGGRKVGCNSIYSQC